MSLAIVGKIIAMPRTRRYGPGGMVFHALNRGVGRMEIFSEERDGKGEHGDRPNQGQTLYSL